MLDTTQLYPQHQQQDLSELRKELRANETIQWSGKPVAVQSLKDSLSIYFFAIPWTGFALFWEYAVFTDGLSIEGKSLWESDMWLQIALPLFGLPFVLIGFGMMVAPFVAYMRAKHTIFAITTQRAITLMYGRRRVVKSFNLENLSDQLERTENSKGIGHLYFSFSKKSDGEGGTYTDKVGFGPITHVPQVEAKLRQSINNIRES